MDKSVICSCTFFNFWITDLDVASNKTQGKSLPLLLFNPYACPTGDLLICGLPLPDIYQYLRVSVSDHAVCKDVQCVSKNAHLFHMTIFSTNVDEFL